MDIYLVIFITLVAALIASVAQLSYKKGLIKKIDNTKDLVKAITHRNIILGLFGYVVSLAIYLYALSNAPLSVVYPTYASSFIFISLLSWIYLKEKVTTTRMLGIMCIFLGIAIISVSAI